jgi:hypothetical protein
MARAEAAFANQAPSSSWQPLLAASGIVSEQGSALMSQALARPAAQPQGFTGPLRHPASCAGVPSGAGILWCSQQQQCAQRAPVVQAMPIVIMRQAAWRADVWVCSCDQQWAGLQVCKGSTGRRRNISCSWVCRPIPRSSVSASSSSRSGSERQGLC